ncbi:MAG: UDP-N-acetylmuramoyl-tripeptide--D-alanyl-D-alanine ligase [Deltaproteobacteria bacterium ADurb.Bin510]|nr:MAG: UDP-N-acetylmuramoyl-tripeptide--D-alanyl-D-alanine ligase [Deltaproteobacteria bacterium ADurb.Bin510]
MKLSLSAIAAAVKGRLIGADTQVTGVSTDSRTIAPGQLFVALKGDNFDGHDYVEQVLGLGAAAAMVSQPPLSARGSLIVVDDTLAALGRLAAHYRQQQTARVVGITGTNGKTTVKELTAAILATAGPTHKTSGNLNNLIGAPLTLFGIEAATRYAVIEMGTNQPGEIASLTAMVRPDVAVLTNVGPGHLEGLGSLAGVLQEKQTIFDGVPAGGWAVYNPTAASVQGIKIPAGLKTLTFSLDGATDVRLRRMISEDLSGSRFEADLAGSLTELDITVPGRHNVLNALAAAAAGLSLGLKPENIASGLPQAVFPGKRTEILSRGGLTIINDCYNAAPASMQAALELLRTSPKPRVAVLGDMRELGEQAASLHAELGQRAAEAGLSRLIATGEWAEVVAQAAVKAGLPAERVAVIQELDQIATELKGLSEACILIKASRALKLELLVNQIMAEA